MTPDDLQKKTVAGIDKMLGSWILMQAMTSEEQRILKAQRAFWNANNVQDVQALLAYWNEVSEPH